MMDRNGNRNTKGLIRVLVKVLILISFGSVIWSVDSPAQYSQEVTFVVSWDEFVDALNQALEEKLGKPIDQIEPEDIPDPGTPEYDEFLMGLLGSSMDLFDVARGTIMSVPREQLPDEVVSAADVDITTAIEKLVDIFLRDRKEPNYLAPAMLAEMAKLWAQAAIDSNVFRAAGIAPPTVKELSDRIYGIIKSKGIVDYSLLFNNYLTIATDDVAELMKEAIVAQIRAMRGDVSAAQKEINRFVQDVVGNLPSYRIASLAIPSVTSSIRDKIQDVLDTSSSPGDEAYWDERLSVAINKVKSEILKAPDWPENEIVAGILGIGTGLSAEDILANPDDPEIVIAIAEEAEEFQPLMYAALRQLKSSWVDELKQQITDLDAKVATLSQQVSALQQRLSELDALEQEVINLRGRRDILPLTLAIIALVLGVAAVRLSVARRQRA